MHDYVFNPNNRMNNIKYCYSYNKVKTDYNNYDKIIKTVSC